jgi:hypothetical protein
MTFLAPSDIMGTLAKHLAAQPCAMVPPLVKALVALKGRGGARRILELAIMAVEDVPLAAAIRKGE